MEDFRYKSLKPWKIENIDLTEQFSLSIFTNFLYQSIKITWLLPIFIETDFYRLTSPGSKGLWKISTYVTGGGGGGGGGGYRKSFNKNPHNQFTHRFSKRICNCRPVGRGVATGALTGRLGRDEKMMRGEGRRWSTPFALGYWVTTLVILKTFLRFWLAQTPR